ncbi:hypothetical protein G7Y79_00050g085520 [Physcia stellaris]|nr:hypothetical protein G7Y79_00050g085520 [Physcia stellaris]
MSPAAQYLGQFHGSRSSSLRRKRTQTSEFLKGVLTKEGRRQRRDSKAASMSPSPEPYVPLTVYSHTLLLSELIPRVSTDPNDSEAQETTESLAPPAPSLPSSQTKSSTLASSGSAPAAARSVMSLASAASSTASFKSALSTLKLDTSLNMSDWRSSKYSQEIQESPFYCCSLEYARRSANTPQGRAPLFVVSESPTEQIVNPCREAKCPVSAAHSEGAYRYLGKPVPQFLQDELEDNIGRLARHLWGSSNPHPLLWLAFWRSTMGLSSLEEKATVRDFMKAHGLLGDVDLRGDQMWAYAWCQSLGFGSSSPCSSESSE